MARTIHIRFFVEAFFLLAVVIVPLSVHAGFFSKYFTPVQATEPEEEQVVYSAIDTPLLSALQNPDPMGGRGGAEVLSDDNALVSTGPVGEDVIAEQKVSTGEIRVYTVRPEDTPSEIAEMFGITVNTLFWANDITNGIIQPGDTLVILPVSGVKHEVAKGESLSSIVKKYKADTDEVMEYNLLASADDLIVGMELIIPGGAIAAPVRVSAARPVATSGGGSTSGFSHPAPGAVRTQGIHGYNAVDLAAGYGTPIRAAASGEVIVSKYSGWNGGYGQYIVIRHPNGTQTLYAHLGSNAVGVGSYVAQGEVIGGMGNTGRSTGTHLHFEVRGGYNPF